MQLQKALHHIEYVAVDVTSPSRGAGQDSWCLAAFDVGPAQRLQSGACRREPVPQAAICSDSGPGHDSVPALLLPTLLGMCLAFLLGCMRRGCKNSTARYEQQVDEVEVPPQTMGEVRWGSGI